MNIAEFMHQLKLRGRLDQFDYERMGVEEKWGPRRTILLLTSFEMETKGYFDREDAAKAYNTIYSKYQTVVMKPLFENAFPFFRGPDMPDDGVDLDRARFKQEDFLRYLEENNNARVDIPRLMRFLAGEECPAAPIYSLIDEVAADDEVHEVSSGASSRDIVRSYRFERKSNGWNLQFDDVRIMGVKDWVGLTYIKILLQNPDKKISVFDLQRMTGDCNESTPSGYHYDSYPDTETSCASGPGGPGAWTALDTKAKGDYLGRLEKIEIEVKEARRRKDHNKINDLLIEAEFIQKELASNQGKPKDPEAEKNRKKVCNAITDAINKIKKLEDAYNYCDGPISGHLRRHIKTGLLCSYLIEPNKLPTWEF